MNMKKIFSGIMLTLLAACPLTSCMDEWPVADTEDLLVTCPTDLGEVNFTIKEVKDEISKNVGTSTNGYFVVDKDLILEGVVCANDVSGNLYQTLLLRNIDTSLPEGDPGRDQCLVLAVKNTNLAPYFALGQRVRVNLKGLYIGVYSRVPKIGQPYKTSAGNWRLGPILFELCKSNVQLIGDPDPSAPELVPVDLTDDEGDSWLRASANRNIYNTPMLASVRGSIDEVQDDKKAVADKGSETSASCADVFGKEEPLPKIFGPYNLHDAGFGIDRTCSLVSNNSNVSVRTSTRNDISYTEILDGIHTYTGMLTYYSTWQIQLRDLGDIDYYDHTPQQPKGFVRNATDTPWYPAHLTAPTEE